MRKFALLSIILIVSLIMGACGPKETATEEVAPTSPPQVVPTEETTTKPDLGGQEINVAVENAYPPFNYIDSETNEPTGWDYDAVRAICEVINCNPVFVEAAWEGIFEATAAGEYDIVADGVTITAERDEIVDFSIPYMVIAQYIMVRTDETKIMDEASLAASDALVGTQIGTTNEARAIELVGEDRVRSFDTFDLPVQALMTRDVDAVVIDEEAGKGFIEQFPSRIKLLADPITGFEELGFVFPPGSDLVEPVNFAIRALQTDGTFNELYEKYWGEVQIEPPLFDLDGQEISVAVENAYPPFNYIDEDTNQPTGWDYDAVTAICVVINCNPVFVEAAWEGIFEATAAGEYDMVADGVTITAERDEIVDFSIPYMVIAQYIMVRMDETEIVDEASLAASDVMVGTQIGTTNEARAIELVGEDRVQSFDTFDLPVQALIAGDVSAVVIDEEAGKGFVEQFPDEIMLLPDPITGFEELGFVFPPGSDLVEPVNWAIQVLQDNGTLNLLYLRYWGQE